MIKLENTFSIGCLVQWYEIEIIGEYIESLKNALKDIENVDNVMIDITLTTNQELEKIDDTIEMSEIVDRYNKLVDTLIDTGAPVKSIVTDKLVTIAEYRRLFNDIHCHHADVLMWGETDSLLPKQTFEILDNLHSQVKNTTPKYVSFFGICKMWDESWKPIEHTKFTDKPFIEDDYDNWWSVKYTMSLKEMYDINDKVDELDVRTLDNGFKFNGCGLVISSEVIKSGINIPKSVFFVHEDTAFQNMMMRMYGPQTIPQYIIKNILLVHNRNHPKKRMYIEGESGRTMNMKRRSNDWYVKANQMCEHNAYNLFNQDKAYTWKDVFK